MADPPAVQASIAPAPANGLARFLDAQLALDARSLALGRIAIAALLLYDLGLRATDLGAHYSDAGVWPRAILHLRSWSFVWSVHALGGSPVFEGALFAGAAVAGLALLVGFHTRAATLVSLVLALSVQARNPFLHDGQDDLLRLLLFWSLWLPLGARWSFDARRDPLPRVAGEGQSGGSPGFRALGLAGQLALIYESSAVGKLQSGWWTSGYGIAHALQLGRYETEAGRWLVTHAPAALHALNFPVIALEMALPLLLWIPWQRERLRFVAIGLAVLLHGSFWIFLRLSIFPALSIAAWLFFLPAAFWDRAAARAGRHLNPRDVGRGAPALWTAPFLFLEILYVIGTHTGQPLLPGIAREVVEALGLQQYWVVFSPPQPDTVTDGYFVAPGLRSDGSQVDLFKPDELLTWEKPPLVSASFRDTRWRHFYANLVVEWARGSDQWRDTYSVREATARWLCRDYAARHPGEEKLVRASLYFVEHAVDHPDELPTRRLLAQVACLQ